jgi:hypothetical protein
MTDRNITNIKYETLLHALGPLGFTVEQHFFDGGESVFVKGFGNWVLGESHYGDSWTAAGDALSKMIGKGIAPEVVVESLFTDMEDEE